MWNETVVGAGGDQIGKHHLVDHLTKGKSWREIDDFIRGVGGRMKVSEGNKGNEHGWKRWQGG